MKENAVFFTENIYAEHLTIINGVNFTPREIDVIACLLSARGTSKIATLLSISPRTVVTHVRNIMLKLECNSREGVIDFIETSHKLPFLREYYSSLVTELSFEKCLKKISKLRYEKTSSPLLVYWQDQDLKQVLIKYLKTHLNHADLHAEVHEYLLGQTIENQKLNSLIFFEKKDQEEIPTKLTKLDFIDLTKQKNYYFSVIEVLKKLLIDANVDDIFTNFKDQYDEIKPPLTKKNSNQFEEENLENNNRRLINRFLLILKARKWHFLCAFSIMSLSSIGFHTLKQENERIHTSIQALSITEGNKEKAPIRSELSIPIESIFLNRPELLAQVDLKLAGQKGIQSVALVGPGGAGKTTLARQYAHQQKNFVTWEINAENTEGLKVSFNNLAQALAGTEEDRKILRELQDILNPTDREEKIIQFVKKCLQIYSNWFLIYDNVEKYSNIQKYFPEDSAVWGDGKVILTTRDSTIQNNKHINNIVQIDELTPTQKLSLFSKIMGQNNSYSLIPLQNNEAKVFLENLPPYPLDISIAAYYIKSTNFSYSSYLENIHKNNKDFIYVQEDILRDAGNYKRTRYEIITLSLQQLIKINKDFKNLLFFISLLDSQHIPQELLDEYKNKMFIGNFIYNLKKYSLISHSNIEPSLGSRISLHRSTQSIIFEYLIKILSTKEKIFLVETLSSSLEKHVNNIIDKEEFSKINLVSLITHCEKFLENTRLLHTFPQKNLEGALGEIYFHLGDYEKSTYLLKLALSHFNRGSKENHPRIARALVYLGMVYKELGNNKEARSLLDESIALYKKNLSENYLGLARALAYSGLVYKSLGNYSKAQELLEESIMIYQQHLPKSHIGLARALGYLGVIHKDLGRYEKAKNLINQSYALYRNSENHLGIGRDLAYLGIIEMSLGSYEKAKSLLEQSFAKYKQILPENHANNAWVLTYLGNVYNELGYYNEAKSLLEKSHLIYKNHFSNTHVEIVWILVYLANTHKELGNYKIAKDLLEKSLAIYRKNFPDTHIKVAWILAYLGNIYTKLGHHKDAKDAFEKSILIHNKHYGENHVETAKALKSLGEVYLIENNIEKGEHYLHKALDILQENKHPDLYRVFEVLAESCLRKLSLRESKKDTQQSQDIKAQAISYLEKALKVIQTHFTDNSPHIQRVQLKLRNLEP